MVSDKIVKRCESFISSCEDGNWKPHTPFLQYIMLQHDPRDMPTEYSDDWEHLWMHLISHSKITITLMPAPTDKMVELHKMMHEI